MYWITISQELFINIFEVKVQFERLQPVGKALLSECLDKVGWNVNKKKHILQITGCRPGSFFKAKVTIEYDSEEKSNLEEIEAKIASGIKFIQESGI